MTLSNVDCRLSNAEFHAIRVHSRPLAVPYRRPHLFAVGLLAILTFNLAEPPALLAAEDAPSARDLVREGNELLRAGQAAPALEAYSKAGEQKPDALHIDFDRGLAHYALQQFDDARAAFEKASLSGDPGLADEALYALGATDHAQALQQADNPQAAITGLESAMRRYQDVLSHQPDHAAARDAHYKAAMKWRQLKEQLQQQQQQQDQQQQDEQQDQQQQDQQQNQQQNEQQQSQDQQQQDQQQEQQEQQQQQQQSEESEEQKQEEQQQEAGQQQEQQEQTEQQQQQQAQAQPEPTREQAQRELRRLMDHLRRRLQQRRDAEIPVPTATAEKDW